LKETPKALSNGMGTGDEGGLSGEDERTAKKFRFSQGKEEKATSNYFFSM